MDRHDSLRLTRHGTQSPRSSYRLLTIGDRFSSSVANRQGHRHSQAQRNLKMDGTGGQRSLVHGRRRRHGTPGLEYVRLAQADQRHPGRLYRGLHSGPQVVAVLRLELSSSLAARRSESRTAPSGDLVSRETMRRSARNQVYVTSVGKRRFDRCPSCAAQSENQKHFRSGHIPTPGSCLTLRQR